MLQDRDQDAYARPPYAGARGSSREMQSRQEEQTSDPSTVLVFRDQRHREIQNYAIVGSTLWNFTPQRTEKIPIAELDVPATIKANDERGVDFKLPRSTEGQ